MNNFNEIKLMLPDYINGRLNETESESVKHALAKSEELRKLFQEMKRASGLVTQVNFPDPGDLYWSALLPEIHKRLEKRKSLSGIGIFKQASPAYYVYAAAAVILLTVSILQWNNIYKFFITDKPEIISETDTAKISSDGFEISQKINDSIPHSQEQVPETKTRSTSVRDKNSNQEITETNDEIIFDEESFDFLSGYTEEDIFEELNSLSPEEEIKLLETLNNNL